MLLTHNLKTPFIVVPPLSTSSPATWDQGNNYFPATTWQISNIHAGTGAANVIPGTLELIFNFRYATCSTLTSLQAQLESVLQRHQLRYELTWLGHSKPYLSEAGSFSKLLKESHSFRHRIYP